MKRIIGLTLICALLLTGCGGQSKIAMQTPEETIDTAFNALKELDMDTFNICTNNKAAGGYRLLSDLFTKQDDKEYHELAMAMVEHLSWEIGTVEITDNTATANVIIHNKDFSDAIGMFVADLIKHVNKNQKEGMDLSTLIRSTADKAKESPEAILPYLKQCDKEFSIETKIQLKKNDDSWQIQLDESLCDSLTGHLGTDNLSDYVTAKISATEELLKRNLERWGVSEETTNQWTEKLENRLNDFLK